ncbi:hypothetical protein H9P43_006270 [Blastocladiella emersonii ATCC 22665]|nr:hypothetical protein H9P43_006270 [Blastocladiella emersonii ATCC 22665]
MPCKQVPGTAGTAFGLEWFHGKDGGGSDMGPQRKLLSELQDNETVIKRLVDKGVDNHGEPKAAHYFAKVKTVGLAGLLNKNRCIQEMVHPERLSKVYFDIDCLGNNKDVTLDVIKKVILAQFPGANLQVCGYETDLKKSWHIVLSNYTATLKDMSFLKLFCSHPDHVKLGFDASVYSKHRFMKCINQSKPKKTPGTFKAGNKDRLSKHLIQYDFDPNCVPISDLSFVKFVSAEAKAARAKRRKGRFDYDLDIPEFKDVQIDPDFFYYDATPLEILHNLPVSPENAFHNNVTWLIMTWAMRKGVTFEQFWAWTSQQDNSAQRFAKYQQRWGEIASNCDYQVPDKFIKAIFYKRFRDAFKSKAMIKFEQSLQVPANVTVPNQFLSCNDITEAKFNVLATGMGSNKTGAVCDYIANIKDKKTMGEHAQLIVSPCSLHYLTKPYDIVVVDESETVLKMFQDAKLHTTTISNNLEANLKAFKTLCEHKGSKGIFMDAFITNLTMDVLRSFTVKHNILTATHGKIKVITNTLGKTFVLRTMSLITHDKNEDKSAKDIMESNIIADLKANKKLYLFIPRPISKSTKWSAQTFGEYLERVFAKEKWKIGKQIKLYHGDRPNHEDKELADPDSVWGDNTVRIVIANLKITVGVNFSTKNKFDKVYARYESWVPARDFFQAIYRVRYPKDNEIVFMISRGCRSMFMNKSQVINSDLVGKLHQAIVKNTDLENEMAAVTSCLKVFDAFRKVANIVMDNSPEYYYMAHPEIEDLPSKETLHDHCKGTLKDPDWTICLSVRKAFFICKFKGLSEDNMEAIWDDNAERFMERIQYFYTKDKAHVLHKLLDHNSMDLRTSEEFNVQSTIPTTFEADICKYFKKLSSNKKCGPAIVLITMLDTYFNKCLAAPDKDNCQVTIHINYFVMYKTWTTAPAESAPFVLELDLDEVYNELINEP